MSDNYKKLLTFNSVVLLIINAIILYKTDAQLLAFIGFLSLLVSTALIFDDENFGYHLVAIWTVPAASFVVGYFSGVQEPKLLFAAEQGAQVGESIAWLRSTFGSAHTAIESGVFSAFSAIGAHVMNISIYLTVYFVRICLSLGSILLNRK